MKSANVVALVSVLTLAVSGFGCAATSSVNSPVEAEQLIGIWGAQRHFSTVVEGQIHVYDRAGSLEATIGSYYAPVSVTQNQLKFSLPDNQGTFRGAMSKDRERIVGHWIQPVGVIDEYEFATPVELTQTTDAGWIGEVRPYQERSSLYLRIAKEADGEISAILRNPERNVGVFVGVHHVEKRGADVVFYNADNDPVLTGKLSADDSGEGQEVLSAVLFERYSYDFTRRARDAAPGYYPRSNTAQYAYRMPVANADGWSVASASSVGLTEHKLAEFVQKILDTETDSHRTPYIQDVVLARHGKLVLEEHFYGYHGDLPHDSRSAGKSITSMAVGAAVAEGVVNLDSKVYSIFPGQHEHPDSRKSAMTVEHLLTMSSGYACDDNDADSPGNEGNMQYQGEQDDWLQFTLDLPMVRQPGVAGVYCSAGINLLTGVVSKTTGEWFPEYFRSRLAQPLDIRHYHMNLDPLRQGYGGGGLRLRPRDFLKFGQTMLAGGVWNDRRVLTKGWVRSSLTPRSSVNEENDYGFGWWRAVHDIKGQQIESWSATGNGGQIIIIVPAFDIAMAFNGGNYNNFPTWIAWRDELMPALLTAALE